MKYYIMKLELAVEVELFFGLLPFLGRAFKIRYVHHTVSASNATRRMNEWQK